MANFAWRSAGLSITGTYTTGVDDVFRQSLDAYVKALLALHAVVPLASVEATHPAGYWTHEVTAVNGNKFEHKIQIVDPLIFIHIETDYWNEEAGPLALILRVAFLNLIRAHGLETLDATLS